MYKRPIVICIIAFSICLCAGGYAQQVAMPWFDPNDGVFSTDPNVTITCSTPGATIRYTINGPDPNENDPNVPSIVSGAVVRVPLVGTAVLQARAYKDGMVPSGLKVGAYHWPGPLTLHVRPGGNDGGNGITWATAKATLQAALDVALTGDEIWVAAGTYYPTSDYGLGIGERGKHFRMKNGVGIYGGFAGTETLREQRNFRANATVLSGDIGVKGNVSDNCYHVVYLPGGSLGDSTAVLDGFTITAGNANGDWPYYLGGGMVCSYGNTPNVSNCIFLRNRGIGAGGVYSDTGANFTDCIFEGNYSTNGAVWGSAVMVFDGELTNCVFVGNRGGTLFYFVYGNRHSMRNCTITRNPGTTYLSFSGYSGRSYSNCIIEGTLSERWDTTGPIVSNVDFTTFARDPNAGPDATWGTADDDYGNLRLPAGSQYVDAGANADVLAATDILGNPRIVDGDGDEEPGDPNVMATVDMGAYERQCVANPVGDVSYDCCVEFVDYAMLVGWWGESCSSANWWCYRADVDESGAVDMLDMAAVAEHWLEGI